MYIYCFHLFMSLFIIPSQSVFGKMFAKPLAKEFRKTSNDMTKSQLPTFGNFCQTVARCQTEFPNKIRFRRSSRTNPKNIAMYQRMKLSKTIHLT